MVKIILVIIMAVGLLSFIILHFVLNIQPTFKVGAKVYYRNPIDLCEGKVVKNLKDDVMVETEGKIITLKRTEILGDKN